MEAKSEANFYKGQETSFMRHDFWQIPVLTYIWLVHTKILMSNVINYG